MPYGAQSSNYRSLVGDACAFWNTTEERARFTAASSLDEALRVAIDGWPEGLDKARKLATPLFEKVSHLIERVEPAFDIEGGALDIGRYHDGDPEMFMRFNTVVAESAGNESFVFASIRRLPGECQ